MRNPGYYFTFVTFAIVGAFGFLAGIPPAHAQSGGGIRASETANPCEWAKLGGEAGRKLSLAKKTTDEANEIIGSIMMGAQGNLNPQEAQILNIGLVNGYNSGEPSAKAAGDEEFASCTKALT